VNQAAKYYNRYKLFELLSRRLARHQEAHAESGLRVSMFGTYRERYKQAFNLDYTALIRTTHVFQRWLCSFVPGIGNPLTRLFQCGGKGDRLTSSFGTVTVGSNSSAGCLKDILLPCARLGFAFDPE